MGGVTLHVADAALAALAAAAARGVPGVVAARAAPAAELVRVTIAVRLGDSCRDVAEAVQRAVTHTLAESAGRTALVEVTVRRSSCAHATTHRNLSVTGSRWSRWSRGLSLDIVGASCDAVPRSHPSLCAQTPC